MPDHPRPGQVAADLREEAEAKGPTPKWRIREAATTITRLAEALRGAEAALLYIAPWALGPEELRRRNEAASRARAALTEQEDEWRFTTEPGPSAERSLHIPDQEDERGR